MDKKKANSKITPSDSITEPQKAKKVRKPLTPSQKKAILQKNTLKHFVRLTASFRDIPI